MTKSSLGTATLLALTFGLSNAGDAAANAGSTAVFGLYQGGGPGPLQVDSGIAGRLGCNILRTGKIVAQDGKIGLPQPDSFVMLACPGPILESSGTLLDGLVTGSNRIALFEGSLTALGPRAASAELGSRQYIVKLSTFSKADPSARLRDLDRIDGLVATRGDRYYGEAAVQVSDARGVQRPDEVMVIYYDSPEAGDRFRKGNPDIMQSIGQFNARYVDSFIYYVAIPQD